jgi:hypothetical protein
MIIPSNLGIGAAKCLDEQIPQEHLDSTHVQAQALEWGAGQPGHAQLIVRRCQIPRGLGALCCQCPQFARSVNHASVSIPMKQGRVSCHAPLPVSAVVALSSRRT